MTVRDQLILSIVDKALVGAVLVAVGFWLDRRFDLLRTGRSLMHTMLDRRPILEHASLATQRDHRLAFVEKQLSLLYWPLYMRLQQHEASRRHVERDHDVPGHADAVALIEKHAYLIDDEELLAALLRYVRHVAVGRAVHAGGGASHARPGEPGGPGEPYPEDLLALVERKLAATRAAQQRLLHAKVIGAAL
jgi:hypothetical protein